MQSAERLRRIEQATDLPLLILAITMIPLLVGPNFVELSDAAESSVLVADWLIWAVFAVVFGIKVTVAPNRIHYVRSHWLEVAMVALPFLRPLRALRLLRALRWARVAVALGLNVTLLQELASQRGTKVLVAAVLSILVCGAGFVLLAERDAQGSNIGSFGDALWWASTTMTTVGYGDLYPVTPAGRGVAIALMLFGIAALSALTATIAAFLVREREGQVTLVDVMQELESLRAEVEKIRDRTDEPPESR